MPGWRQAVVGVHGDARECRARGREEQRLVFSSAWLSTAVVDAVLQCQTGRGWVGGEMCDLSQRSRGPAVAMGEDDRMDGGGRPRRAGAASRQRTRCLTCRRGGETAARWERTARQ